MKTWWILVTGRRPVTVSCYVLRRTGLNTRTRTGSKSLNHHGTLSLLPVITFRVMYVYHFSWQINSEGRYQPSSMLSAIHSPFHSLLEIIDQRCQPSVALANLIASPWTPLYTALIILTDSGEKALHFPPSYASAEANLLCSQGPPAPKMVSLTRLPLTSPLSCSVMVRTRPDSLHDLTCLPLDHLHPRRSVMACSDRQRPSCPCATRQPNGSCVGGRSSAQ